MEVATVGSHCFPVRRMAQCPLMSSRRFATSSLSPRASLSSKLFPASVGGPVSSDFAGHTIRPASLNPYRPSRGKRDVVTMVLIPFSAEGPLAPDLASYLFLNRIVYLGMPLVPAVTELLVAEFVYLHMMDDDEPIYLYINSTGTTKDGRKLGYETEAFAIHDAMMFCKMQINSLCVGNAWGEAALLLAAGTKGKRCALQSATIMIRQPMGRIEGKASDADVRRMDMKDLKATLVKLYAMHTGNTRKQIEADINRPKYFSPSDAVEYGIIDKVVYNGRGSKDKDSKDRGFKNRGSQNSSSKDGGVDSDLQKVQEL